MAGYSQHGAAFAGLLSLTQGKHAPSDGGAVCSSRLDRDCELVAFLQPPHHPPGSPGVKVVVEPVCRMYVSDPDIPVGDVPSVVPRSDFSFFGIPDAAGYRRPVPRVQTRKLEHRRPEKHSNEEDGEHNPGDHAHMLYPVPVFTTASQTRINNTTGRSRVCADPSAAARRRQRALADPTCTTCGATYRSKFATTCQHCGAARPMPGDTGGVRSPKFRRSSSCAAWSLAPDDLRCLATSMSRRRRAKRSVRSGR
jgi:hypothetical protein